MNGRTSLSELARNTGLPVSTVHDRLRQHRQNGLLRPSAIVNFEKIGLATRAHILLAVETDQKDKLYAHLKDHPNVNSLFRINNGWSAVMECVFKEMNDLENFLEQIENTFKIKQKQVHYTLEEMKREGSMATQDIAQSLNTSNS